MESESESRFHARGDCYEVRVDPDVVGRLPISFGATGQRLWPAALRPQAVADERIQAIRFPDHATIAERIARELLAQATQLPANAIGLGGEKVRGESFWSRPESRLLTARALLLASHCFGYHTAHATDRWANVMETGDYSVSHCHYEASASAV